jgi:hypothetical protein
MGLGKRCGGSAHALGMLTLAQHVVLTPVRHVGLPQLKYLTPVALVLKIPPGLARCEIYDKNDSRLLDLTDITDKASLFIKPIDRESFWKPKDAVGNAVPSATHTFAQGSSGRSRILSPIWCEALLLLIPLPCRPHCFCSLSLFSLNDSVYS